MRSLSELLALLPNGRITEDILRTIGITDEEKAKLDAYARELGPMPLATKT